MSKAEATRTLILKQAAELFNQQGYAGSSIADIMQATGLQKGGIYNHFSSKDELALAAFDFAIACMAERYAAALKHQRHARDRLKAVIAVVSRSADDPAIAGGCPLLNTAIESDDAHPALRRHAQKAMDAWRGMIHKIVNLGIKKGEIVAIDADEAATVLIAMLEGGIMMSKLYDDLVHIHRVVNYLHQWVDQHCEAEE
jgi:TetR/AcrR family transcriptional regulator, transcriptional repressor for nem operon